MKRLAIALLVVLGAIAHADPDPKRKVVVLEYRDKTSALPGIAKRVAERLGKATSLTLLNPDQARAIYGDHLEQALVKCAGEADCMGRIGQKVGAAEVILIGVIEMGDVIVTMQRVEVATRTVGARISDSLPPGTKPTEQQLDAYLSRVMPPTDFLRYGIIDIVANEAGASVSVGGEPRGVTPVQPIKLKAPATYDIRVEKSGFVPFTASVDVPPDAEIKVKAALQRKGAGPAWYQHWYVLAAASALVVGAGGTTVYFATRNNGTGPTGDGRLPFTGGIQ